MRKKIVQYSLLLLAASTLVSMIICLPQLYGFFDRPFKEELFLLNILITQSFTLNFILYLLIYVLILFGISRQFMVWLSCSLYFLLNVVLFIDTAIYSVFKYHINGLILNIITSEGAKDSVVFGTATMVWSSLIFLLIAAAFYGVTQLYAWLERNKKRRRFFRFNKRILLTLFALILVDKAVYAQADLVNDMAIVRSSGRFLLYQPLTIKRFMAKNFGYDLAANDNIKIRSNYSDLNYPKQPLNYSTGEHYNVVVVVVDSWRKDVVNSEYMPLFTPLTDSLIDFQNHYSGGNATRFGIFSLLYGLYGNMWHSMLAERRSSALLDAVIAKNYDVRVSSSTTLNWPEFRRTAFINVHNEIYDTYAQANKAERDTAQVSDFIRYLDTRNTEKPFFSFLLLDAPHAPYYSMKGYEKFTNSAEEINYLDEESMKKSKEGYLNAVYFTDHLLAKLYHRLQAADLKENTIILFTGDHGEAFGESGYFGHTSAFTRSQTHVPFYLHVPKIPVQKIDYVTSHHDFVPTILPMLGVTNPSTDYSFGHSLFTDSRREGVIITGWEKSAYVTKSNIIVFPIKSYTLRSIEIRDRDYNFVNNAATIFNQESGALLNISLEMSSFYSF